MTIVKQKLFGLNEIAALGTVYRWNPTYKTYNSIHNNSLLHSEFLASQLSPPNRSSMIVKVEYDAREISPSSIYSTIKVLHGVFDITEVRE